MHADYLKEHNLEVDEFKGYEWKFITASLCNFGKTEESQEMIKTYGQVNHWIFKGPIDYYKNDFKWKEKEVDKFLKSIGGIKGRMRIYERTVNLNVVITDDDDPTLITTFIKEAMLHGNVHVTLLFHRPGDLNFYEQKI